MTQPIPRPAEPVAATTQRIPPSLGAMLQRELQASERLLWVGRPSPRRMFVLHGCSALLLGIPILVVGAIARLLIFSKSALGSASNPAAQYFAMTWDVGFFAVLVLILFSRLWLWRKALHTVYAVTDRRALVLEASRGQRAAQSFTGRQLAQAQRREGPDGWGDLVFERDVYGKGAKRVERDVGFLRIPDVARVQRMLPVADAS